MNSGLPGLATSDARNAIAPKSYMHLVGITTKLHSIRTTNQINIQIS
jgi:hypothetical protein